MVDIMFNSEFAVWFSGILRALLIFASYDSDWQNLRDLCYINRVVKKSDFGFFLLLLSFGNGARLFAYIAHGFGEGEL
jgi:hypothetical protein